MTKQRLAGFGAVLVSAVLAAPAFADPQSGDAWQYGHMWGGGYGGGFIGFGMMFLFWGLIILLAVLAARWFVQRDGQGPDQASALDTLKLRLANGSIDVEDFEARKKLLES